jgi:DNA-binding response OmpR family regulator
MEILIVEDEVAIREVEVAYLGNAGYNTTEATDGQQAIDLFKLRGADLAVIDINLPRMNGLELCRQIREISLIPIIMVTAKSEDEDEIIGLDAGADDYIKKPFNPKVLVSRVQALLRRQSGLTLHFGDLAIEPEKMRVTVKEHEISLTTTQFNLLLALATHPDTVFSRTQLIERIYSDPLGHDIYDRTIDAHIKSLRRAIERDPAQPEFIKTVIGSGYTFRGNRHV